VRRVPSPNHDARRGILAPDIIVLHYTEMDGADAAVRWLTDPASRVSAHYLVAADGAVVHMVPEERRAWHAGVSGWDGSADINSRSIGIELDSPGHRPDPPVFPERQIASLLALLADLRRRWPIAPRNVVAHSDVAPERKIDPGERFPWDRLAAAGHVLAVDPQPPAPSAGTAAVRAALAACGYAIGADGPDDAAYRAVVQAFHRRWLPGKLGQPADGATLATARALARRVAADRAADAPVSGA
jgi:N-acetylmuramoyl-L-alanine amidase